MQKRKLLWQGGKEKKIAPSWQQIFAAAGSESEAKEKFKKLAGYKGDDESLGSLGDRSEEAQKRDAELFKRLDEEYEVARRSTHTHRGIGLGFASKTTEMFNNIRQPQS